MIEQATERIQFGVPDWWLPPKEHASCGCLTCGPKPAVLPLDAHIAVGFGDAHCSVDGKIVLREDPNADYDETPTVAEAEALAVLEPTRDWRILLDAPLSMNEYQRHDVGLWVLVRTGMGFA